MTGHAVHTPDLSTWSGTLPSDPRFFFACADTKFFEYFAPALAWSAHKARNPLHLHVINPTDVALDMAKRLNGLSGVTVTWFDDPNPATLEGKPQFSYYSNMRVHLLPQLLTMPTTVRVYTIDIDSVFNQNIDLATGPQNPIGLYLRVNWKLGNIEEKHRHQLRCLACMWWVHKTHIDYAKACAAYIAARDLEWMLDQEALYATAEQMGLLDQVSDIVQYPDLVDYSFSARGVLWTGKGARKLENRTFVARLNELTAECRRNT